MAHATRGNLPSNLRHQFSQVPQAEIPRSSFDRSHGFKTTFDSGYLIPIYVDEALPGDTFSCRVTTFARLSTPIHPFMDNLFCDVFFFAIPNRLVWDNWQKFNGEQRNPGDSTDFLVPQIVTPTGTGISVGELLDYMGWPTQVPGLSGSALWTRAYNLVWNEWFRDQNLQDSVVVDVDDGPDTYSDYVLLRRGKRHDYFTSALPWPQKGPAVNIPLGGNAPISGIASTTGFTPATNTAINPTPGSGDTSPFAFSYNAATTVAHRAASGSLNSPLNIYADLSAATAATINQLRQAFQIQRIYERDARGGTRYTEIIQSHFGVTSPDARLQRPEFLGGGSTPVNVNPIAQTSGTPVSGTPQGNLAGYGTFSHSGVGFTKSFTEHTILLGLMMVRADLSYQQGLNRMFSRNTRFDFYWPALSHIGEQAVLNKEIYAVGSANPTQDAAVFGYQERYAEYRYKPSVITGQFRSTFAQTLDSWHLAQDFTALPVLNSAFIEEHPPVSRVVVVESEPQFLFDAHFDLKCARPMPVYSVPGLIDHF